MSLARRGLNIFRPFAELGRLTGHRELDPFASMFRQLERGRFPNWQVDESFSPAVDIKETDKELIVSAEMPGMKKEDIKVEIDGDLLTLKGERSAETKKETDRYHITERSYGSFERSFQLPETVDSDKVQASYKDGVLHLNIPKQEPKSRDVKRIEIGEGESKSSQ